MPHTRRRFIAAVGATITGAVLPGLAFGAEPPQRKRHVVTLSFDDGFKKSSIKTAEIYEKYKLSACINVVASAHREDLERLLAIDTVEVLAAGKALAQFIDQA